MNVATVAASLLAVAVPVSAAEAGASASAPAPSASRPTAVTGTAFEDVASEPIDLGEAHSPRASLAHCFEAVEAVREGRWDDATRCLVLDAKQNARGPDLARRLEAVIDDTGWIDLATVSDARDGKRNDGLPPNLDEITRITLDGRTEPLRMVRRSDDRGVHWALTAPTVSRVDAWYGALPDRRLRDALVAWNLDAMLLHGPLELLWWQWFAHAVLLVLAWPVGDLLARVTRVVLRHLARLTPMRWADDLAGMLGGPLTLAWSLAIVRLGSVHLLLLEPAYRLIVGSGTA